MASLVAKDPGILIKRCMSVASEIIKLPSKHIIMDYDEEADVLYMSFRRPQRATDTEQTDDGILIRKDGKKIVGLTILSASKR